MLKDIWTNAVGQVIGEISQSFIQAAVRTAVPEDIPQGIAAELARGVTGDFRLARPTEKARFH